MPRTRTFRRRTAALASVIAATLALAACGGSDGAGAAAGTASAASGLLIATTVSPITSIAAAVAGDRARIEGIVPEGTNSHTFEPEPQIAKLLSDADIIFVNGLKLEDPTLELARANMKPEAEIVEIGTVVLPESDYIYDFSFPREGGKPNPHLWTNPPMAKEYARVVRDVLSRLSPTNASAFAANYDAFAAKVDALDEAMKVATATIPESQRKLVTYHDAYAYFAKHYGYSVIGALQPSSFDEPTPKEIADLIAQIKSEGVKAVFGSEVFPSPVLEQIGAETGVRYVDVLRDDDLIGTPGDPEHSWLGLMRFNFATMVEALGGDVSALKTLDVGDVAADKAVYPQ